MPRHNKSVSIALFAVLACFGIAGCDNSATTYACSNHAGLASQPEVGATVMLYLQGGNWPAIGTVAALDEDAIRLQTRSGGTLVADWHSVAAWEAGEDVHKLIRLLDEREAVARYADEVSEMIKATSDTLPGSDR